MDGNPIPLLVLGAFIVLLGALFTTQLTHLRWERRARQEGHRVPGQVVGSRRVRNDKGHSRRLHQVEFTTQEGRRVRLEDEIPGGVPDGEGTEVTVLYHPLRPDRATVIGPGGVPSSRGRVALVAVSGPFLLGAVALLVVLVLL
ncbi:DUF3592 domain-containing protein [Streptomyces sp. NPDC005438]|uniref:DUF3592 domain-containing protein n=1 Tax=Streptomyces sp. NPDC005438 TaxID=3156880 RepID=UPI0033AF8FAB